MNISKMIQEITLRNKSKLLRKSPVIESITAENIKADGDMFYLDNIKQTGKIKMKFQIPKSSYKLIYKIKSNSNIGTVKLNYNRYENVGNFSLEDIVFYIKSNQPIDEIIFNISTEEMFKIEHLELVEIGLVEYKIRKYQQYLKKAIYLIKNDLGIKRKAIYSLKINGLKQTLVKIKEKLQNFNSIDQGQVSSTTSYKYKDKEKIIVVVHEAQAAGATLLSINIVKTIKDISDYEPVVILLRGGPLEKELRKECKVYALNQNTFSLVENIEQLQNVIREITSSGVKYAICNSVVSGLLTKELHDFNVKTITLIHELPTSIFTYDFTTAAEYTRDYSDQLIFASNFVRDKYLEAFKANKEKCYVFPQGMYAKVDINCIDEKEYFKRKLCKKLKISSNTDIILGCGYGSLRKGIDLFAMVAARVIKKNDNVHFLWLGGCDPEVKSWINHDLLVQNIDSNFSIMPFEKKPSYIFGGSDIFLLSSREDPFPSVVLDAMAHYTPVISFENGGGAPEVLEDGRGVIVPYIDQEACAEKILKLLNEKEKTKEIALKAKKYITQLTPQNYVKNILKLLVSEDGKKLKFKDTYKVSVIIPNYNYENFLEERLDTIINQSYRPYEIIFLDDCSTDNSVKKAQSILESCGIEFKVITNKVNNGCFRQWLKGIQNATGDFIWIAEADDSCELDFLNKLVDKFDDEEVNLAYAQSEIIDENSVKSGFVYTEYTKDLDAYKWNSDYINNGAMEILEGLGIKNTIPNASSVIMRKSALIGIDELLKEYNIAGDWFAYVYVIKEGKIGFCKDVLNYHRRHTQSIISKCEQNIGLFIELMKVKKFIAQNFLISETVKERFLNHVSLEYERLSCAGYPKEFKENDTLYKIQQEIEGIINKQIKQYTFLSNRDKKNILFIAPDFEMGGGQMLVVRLSNYLSRFHNVYLYNARPWLQEERVLSMLNASVKILESNGDPEQLKQFIKQYNIQVINTHIWWSDKIAFKAIKDMPNITPVLSMHGCYEALLSNPEWDIEFKKLVPQIFNRANNIIYATQKNRKIFEVVDTEQNKIKQVYYGYEKESIPKKSISTLGIPNDAFVFGLVSRGIKEKGWEEAIGAAIQVNERIKQEVHLILIGSSKYELNLKKQYEEYTYIHFVDDLSKPSEWIGWVKTFDVGLLPTYFISESLPNTVIEYLAYEVPVISTNIGEIKNMLINDTAEAGIVLELEDGRVKIGELANAMERLIKDKELYSQFKDGTRELFKQFDIKNFVEEYYKLF